MKSILITGNMGYVGPQMVRHLRQVYPTAHLSGFDAGYFCSCLIDRSVFPECMLDVQHFGDMRNPDSAVFEHAQSIVHLAGISNDPIGSQFEEVTLDVNTQATYDLASRAKQAGVRSFVFASSCSVYGAADSAPRTEESEVGPLTAYAKSKVAAEDRLRTLADANFTVTCLRFATACGYSPRLRLDLVLNDFTALAYKERTIQILSDGTPWRPLIHVDDMARAAEWAISRAHGPAFLVVNAGCNEWIWQVRDLAAAVARRFPGTSVHVNPNAAPDKRSYRVDFSLYKQLAPAHQPHMTLESAIDGLAHGLERSGYRHEHEPWRYSRLKFLSHLTENNRLDKDLRWISESPRLAEEAVNDPMSESLMHLGHALGTGAGVEAATPDLTRVTRA